MSPLTREEKPCWLATCDCCGEGDGGYDGIDHIHYENEEVATRELEGMGWECQDDGKWLCENCLYERRGEKL